jgi:hypothetical protein
MPVGSVRNHMTMSIVLTIVSFLVCNWIATVLAIIAIVFGSKVTNSLVRGDQVGAVGAARIAKILDIVALVLTVLTVFAWVAIIAAGSVNTSTSG